MNVEQDALEEKDAVRKGESFGGLSKSAFPNDHKAASSCLLVARTDVAVGLR